MKTMILSVFYNKNKGLIETIFTDSPSDNPPGMSATKGYIDNYCPPELRMIDGVDTLSMRYVVMSLDIEKTPISKIGRS